MTRSLMPLLAAFLTTGCANAAQDAEERYEMVEKAGASKAELCAEAGKVADAWLTRKDQENYQRWKLRRDTTCLSANYE